MKRVFGFAVLAALLPAMAWVPALEAQALEFVEAEINGVNGLTGLGGSRFVVVSPDGRHVYASAEDDSAINVFARGNDGELTQIQVVVDDVDGDGFGGTDTVAISQDGRHVYAGATTEAALAVFDRNPATGELTFKQVVREGVDLPNGLSSVVWITVSRDGKNVYTSAFSDDAVAVFDRNPADGTLSFVQLIQDGVGGVNFLDGVFPVEVSPDGRHVYAGSLREHAVSVFERNRRTGELTLVQVVEDLVGGVEGLFFLRGLAVSPDGRRVYTVGLVDSALSVFERDRSSGELTFVQVLRQGVDGVDGLRRPTYVTESGGCVFVTDFAQDAVAAFARSGSTLSFVEAVFEGVGGVMGLSGAIALAASQDHQNLYAASFGFNVGDGAIAVFEIGDCR